MAKDSSPGPSALSRVRECLKPVLSRRAGLALGLWGEPGIGKSYTVHGLLWETPCRSFSLHATTPLPALVRELGEPPRSAPFPLWAQALLERLRQGEHLESEKAASALSVLLASLAPVVLHLEDLHEAPAERLEMAQKMARMISRSRGAALLVTSRVLPPEPFRALRIEPLSFENSRSLLEAELESSLPSEAVLWIYEQAQGNPLFTLEYLRHLARQGFLWNDGSRWHWRTPLKGETPVTVEALIEQTLKEAARGGLEAIIAAKAVLPLGVEEAFWAQVAEVSLESLEHEKHRLEAAGVLRNGEFVHPLYREVALQSLEPSQSQHLARRALKTLGQSLLEAEALVRLVEAAGLSPQESQEWLERAAARSEAGGEAAKAARLRATAVTYAADKALPALEAARALRSFDPGEAIRLAEQAVAANPGQTEAVHLLAELLATRGRMAEVDAVLAYLPPDERQGPGWGSRLLILRALVGDFAGALEVWQNNPSLHPIPDPEVLYQASFAHSATGDPKTGLEIATRALELPGLTLEQRAKLSSARAGACYYMGDYSQADAYFAQALRLARESGLPKPIAHISFNRAYTLGLLARYAEMQASLEEAIQAYSELGELKRYAHAKVLVAQLYMGFAEYQRAEEALLESRNLLLQMDPSESLVDCEKTLSRLYWLWRPPYGKVLALKHAYASLEAARKLRSPRNLINGLIPAAHAETWQGRPERGLELAQEALTLAEQLGQPWFRLSAHLAMADALEGLGRPDEALEVYRQAEAAAINLKLMVEADTIGLEVDRLAGNSRHTAERIARLRALGLKQPIELAQRYFPELFKAEAAPRPMPDTPSNPEKRIEGHPPGALRLQVLGPVLFAGAPVRGRKRQELLALLLEARVAGRSEVGRLELLDALYTSEDEEKAASSLKELIHSVRSTLGTLSITTTPTGYALGEAVSSDVEEFLRTGESGLWRGAYLEGLSPLSSFNESVRETVHLTLRLRTEALLEADPKEAVRLGRILLEAEPYDMGALRLTLEALRRAQNYKGLSRLYEEARGRMQEVGETLPPSWQSFLG